MLEVAWCLVLSRGLLALVVWVVRGGLGFWAYGFVRWDLFPRRFTCVPAGGAWGLWLGWAGTGVLLYEGWAVAGSVTDVLHPCCSWPASPRGCGVRAAFIVRVVPSIHGGICSGLGYDTAQGAWLCLYMIQWVSWAATPSSV